MSRVAYIDTNFTALCSPEPQYWDMAEDIAEYLAQKIMAQVINGTSGAYF